MKIQKSIIIALTAACSLSAAAGELTLNVAEPGTLATLITAEQKYSTTKLTLTGTINGLDWQTIREMAGCDFYWHKTAGTLEELDIAGVTIVGGDPVVIALGSDPTNPVVIPARDNALSEELFTSTSIRHIVMPESITAIYSAFSGAALEGTVTVPEGVEILGEYAFEGCSNVEAFILPSTLRDIDNPRKPNKSAIGASAFANCTSLKNLTLPAGVTLIKGGTFANCTFTSFTLPATVDFIDYGAFDGCTSLRDIIVERQEPATLYYEAFHGVDLSNVVLHVPAGTVDAYKAADGWCDFGIITDSPFSGIETATTASSPEIWYSINGTRLPAAPTAPGLYITPTRKLLIK